MKKLIITIVSATVVIGAALASPKDMDIIKEAGRQARYRLSIIENLDESNRLWEESVKAEKAMIEALTIVTKNKNNAEMIECAKLSIKTDEVYRQTIYICNSSLLIAGYAAANNGSDEKDFFDGRIKSISEAKVAREFMWANNITSFLKMQKKAK